LREAQRGRYTSKRSLQRDSAKSPQAEIPHHKYPVKIRFFNTGSNATVANWARTATQSSLEAWSSLHGVDCDIRTGDSVTVQFNREEDFTVFLLTWDTQNRTSRKYKIVEE